MRLIKKIPGIILILVLDILLRQIRHWRASLARCGGLACEIYIICFKELKTYE